MTELSYSRALHVLGRCPIVNCVASCRCPAAAAPLLRFRLPSLPDAIGMVLAPGSASGTHPFYVAMGVALVAVCVVHAVLALGCGVAGLLWCSVRALLSAVVVCGCFPCVVSFSARLGCWVSGLVSVFMASVVAVHRCCCSKVLCFAPLRYLVCCAAPIRTCCCGVCCPAPPTHPPTPHRTPPALTALVEEKRPPRAGGMHTATQLGIGPPHIRW